MNNIERIEDLTRDEQIDIIIGQFSGHEREDEVADILATLTSYKVTGDDYIKYYESLVDEEIKERISDAILNIGDKNVVQYEENAWNSIINALGIVTIFEIMDNWKRYVSRSIKIEYLLSDTKEHLYTEFLLED